MRVLKQAILVSLAIILSVILWIIGIMGLILGTVYLGFSIVFLFGILGTFGILPIFLIFLIGLVFSIIELPFSLLRRKKIYSCQCAKRLINKYGDKLEPFGRMSGDLIVWGMDTAMDFMGRCAEKAENIMDKARVGGFFGAICAGNYEFFKPHSTPSQN